MSMKDVAILLAGGAAAYIVLPLCVLGIGSVVLMLVTL